MNIYMINEEQKHILMIQAMHMYTESISSIEDDTVNQYGFDVHHCLSMKQRVELILEELRVEYAYIITREYIKKEGGAYYLNYFDENDYLNHKKHAIDSFLHCLYGSALL